MKKKNLNNPLTWLVVKKSKLESSEQRFIRIRERWEPPGDTGSSKDGPCQAIWLCPFRETKSGKSSLFSKLQSDPLARVDNV